MLGCVTSQQEVPDKGQDVKVSREKVADCWLKTGGAWMPNNSLCTCSQEGRAQAPRSCLALSGSRPTRLAHLSL